jgi:hypothetical protein
MIHSSVGELYPISIEPLLICMMVCGCISAALCQLFVFVCQRPPPDLPSCFDPAGIHALGMYLYWLMCVVCWSVRPAGRPEG